jgi:hypothetical protein
MDHHLEKLTVAASFLRFRERIFKGAAVRHSLSETSDTIYQP